MRLVTTVLSIAVLILALALLGCVTIHCGQSGCGQSPPARERPQQPTTPLIPGPPEIQTTTSGTAGGR